MAVLPRKQPTFPQRFLAKLPLKPVSQYKPRIRREPNPKLLDRVLIQTAPRQILPCPRPLRPSQTFLEKSARPLMDLQQHRPQPGIFRLRLAAESLLGQRHPHLLRHRPDRLRQSNVLDLLDKSEHIPRNPATKTVIKLPRRMDRK